MQKKNWVMASLGLGIALTVMIFLYPNQNSDAINESVSAKYQHTEKIKLSATDKKADMVCAILIMPKSYLPLLEKFKHSKLAKGLEIVPAKIGWENDQMVAFPQKAVLKTGDQRMKDVSDVFSPKRVLTGKLIDEKMKPIRGTMALLLFKTVAESLPNYKFRQGFTSGGNY